MHHFSPWLGGSSAPNHVICVQLGGAGRPNTAPLTGLEPQLHGMSQPPAPLHQDIQDFVTTSSWFQRIKQKLPDLLRGRPGAHTQHHFRFIVLVRVSHKPAQIQGGGK